MKRFSSGSAVVFALVLSTFVTSCKDADGDGEHEVEGDEDSDSATLRRQAMNEWYHDTAIPPDQQTWSREYRRFLLEAAKKERLRWGKLLPNPEDAFKVPLVAGTSWSNLGPNRADFVKNGSTTLNVTDSGRVRSIIVDGSRVLVATAAGGVWRSDDLGGTWTPITESLGTLSTGSLAMDPAAHDTLYLGLGDPFDGTGIGLVKSTDAGDTWSDPVFLGDSTVIPEVLVAPQATSVVLAATNKGLYRSGDAGATFSLVNIATGNAAAPYVWSLGWTGGHSFVLALEANHEATSGTTDGQIWTSTDDGATWTRATGFTKSAGLGRATVAAAPSNRQIVYAMAAVPNATSASDLADIFKSTDGGRTWTAKNITSKKRYTNSNTESTNVITLLNGQGWYDQLVIVSPTDPNRVYFGGALLLARTTDGGSTFTQMSNWLAKFNLPYVHADFHAATFDGAGTLYVGTDGGVFVSADGGASFTDALNVGIITHLLYSVGSSPQSPAAVIGGLQDNGTRVRAGTSTVFNQSLGGDGFGSNVNLSNGQLMLGSLYYARIYKSTDGGGNFVSASSGITESNNATTAPFITRIVPWEGSTTGNEVYTFSNLKVYRSANYAGSWTSIGSPTTTGAIRHIGVAASNPNVIGVVASGGRVFLSSNGGTTFALVASGKRNDVPAPIPPPLPNSELSLSYIHFDVSNTNVVYVASVAPVAGASHLWKSSDFGATWANLDSPTSGLPVGVPINIIKSDPEPDAMAPGRVLYAGTHMGVYRSTDGGGSWSRFGANLPLVSVMDLYVSPDSSLVRAATYGRGFWELGTDVIVDDFGLGVSPASISAAQGAGADATVATTVTAGSAQAVSFSVTGLPAGASATFVPPSVTAGESATLTVNAAASTPPGSYTLTITGASPSATHTRTLGFTVTASDFSLAADPTSVSAGQGESAAPITVATAVTSGVAQNVSLSVLGLPAGATADFAPSSVTAGASSTLTLTAGAGTSPGTYSLTVRGVGASATRTTPVSFTVTGVVTDDFSLSAATTSISASQGASAPGVTISTSVTSGNAQNVSLSVTGLPPGASATFSPGSVTAGDSSTLTLSAAANTAAGTYPLTVVGTGASVTRTVDVSLTVVASDFSLSAGPASVTAVQGASAPPVTVTAAVSSGAAQTVSLSAGTLPAGVMASFNPTSITGSGSSTLTLATSAATPTGTYTVTVTAVGPSATHTTSFGLTVNAPAGGPTPLTNGVPVTNLSGATGSQKFFTLAVPAGASNLVITMSGGTGDADLYTKFGSAPTTASYDCRPFITGNNESCSVASPQVGTYHVMLNAFSAYSGVTLTASYTLPATLQNGAPITNISGGVGSQQLWRMLSVPAGATVTVRITGSPLSSNDADLYVRRGAAPTTATYDCRPYLVGSNETCTLTNNSGGAADYYVMLRGFTAYSGVTLSGSH